MPAQAFPPKNTEPSNHPDRAGRVPLNNHRVERVRKHCNVALRASRSVEHDQLVPAVDSAQDPTREPIGKASSGGKRLLAERRAGDLEFRLRRPDGWIRFRLEDRSAARSPALVDGRTQSLIDLLDQRFSNGRVFAQT